MSRQYDMRRGSKVDEVQLSTAEAVDAYITSTLPHNDEILDQALAESDGAGLPAIAVSTTQAKFLYLLLKSLKAKRVIEFGTLGGFSAIWLARANAEAYVWTFELSEAHAEVARRNIERAGLSDRVEVVVGKAEEEVKRLTNDGTLKDIDVAFIDADKESNATYIAQSLAVSKPGSVIIVDNVVRSGNVANASHPDTRVQGVRKAFEYLKELEDRGYLETTALQTVGEKGYDGFTYSLVKSLPTK